MVWLIWNWIILNDGLWIVGRAWGLIYVQVNFEMGWNGVELVWIGRTPDLGFLCANVQKFLWTFECWDSQMNGWVGTFERSFETFERWSMLVISVGRCKRSNVWNFGWLAWRCSSSNVHSERSNVESPRAMGARRQTFERLSWMFERSKFRVTWPGVREFEHSLQEFELSAFDWCLGRLPRP